jgi:hypothetical protein
VFNEWDILSTSISCATGLVLETATKRAGVGRAALWLACATLETVSANCLAVMPAGMGFGTGTGALMKTCGVV